MYTIDNLKKLKEEDKEKYFDEITMLAHKIIKLSICETCGSKYLTHEIPNAISYRRISRVLQTDNETIDYILDEYRKIK